MGVTTFAKTNIKGVVQKILNQFARQVIRSRTNGNLS